MNLFIKSQGQGNPLIFLHGWGFDHRIWDSTVEKWIADWQVYQVDLPGHGQSAWCEYHLPTLTQQLAHALPQNAIWVGWSLGGLLAMNMAICHPTQVRALVLIGTSPRFVTAADWQHAMSPEILCEFMSQLQTDRTGTLQRFLALQTRGSRFSGTQLHILRTVFKQTKPIELSVLQAGLKLLMETDLRPQLASIQCPALLCVGERDTIVPAPVAAACQQWCPRLQTVIIPAAAHLPFLSHPDLFTATLQQFLYNSNVISASSTPIF